MGFFLDDKKIIAKNEDETVAYLITASDSFEAELICNLLKDSGIPAMTKEGSFGSISKIVSGRSFFGSNIYVVRERLEEAKEILTAFTEGASEEAPENAEEE